MASPELERQAIQAFTGLGWTSIHACGMVANLEVESDLNPAARGDRGLAVGLAQEHPDRVATIERGIGINMRTAGLIDQIRGVDWEIRHTQPEALEAVIRSGTPFAAGYAVSMYYERPGDAHAQAVLRGNKAVELYRAHVA